ncbi:MAG: sigma-70 family RNA polymerase sigma factor [Verrucomicrobiota bacterium]
MDSCVNEPIPATTAGSNPLRSLPDGAEFAALYEEHSKAVYYLALRFLADPQKAEDVTHDVFLKVYRKLGEFRGESSLRTWLYRITINHCQNLKQSWASRNLVTTGDDTVWNSTAAPAESPLRVLETKELGERIQNALEALTEEYRLLLLLVADEELSYDEVAALTDQTPDAVRGKLHRARKAFAVHFAKTA